MNRDKMTARLIQFVAVAVFLGMAFLAIQTTGVLSGIGVEDVYWERARYLLGQGGATLYDGNSICSIGYSLLLLPICILIKSPYAAYKAALFLNGIFVSASYFMAVLTARKLFSKEKESFLSVACFFAIFCPVFASATFYTGPESIELLLVWCSIFFLSQIWINGKISSLIPYTICLVLMVFMQIETLGSVIVCEALLWITVKNKKMSENTFLKSVLAVLIGTIAGVIIEKIVLYGFVGEMDITVNSSLEYFFEQITNGWENGYLFGIITAIIGKSYMLMLSSFLLICPVIWKFCRDIYFSKKEQKHTDRYFNNAIIVMCLVQLICVAISDNGQETGAGLLSVTGIIGVISPIILIGIIYLREYIEWTGILLWSLLAFFVCAFITGNVLEQNGVSRVAGLNCGIFKLFQDYTDQAVAAVYVAACIIALVVVLVLFLLNWNGRKKIFRRGIHTVGIIVAFGLFLFLNLFMLRNTAARSAESELENISPIAAILTEARIGEKGYYITGTENDDEIVVLQSLMPEISIIQVKNDAQKQAEAFATEIRETENVFIITGAKDTDIDWKLKEELKDFYITYMTHDYALWVRKNDSSVEELEKVISGRAETMLKKEKERTEFGDETETESELSTDESETQSEVLVEEESESETDSEKLTETSSETEQAIKNSKKSKKAVYGKGYNLAAGTYRMEIYFDTEEAAEGLTGKITVSAKEGVIYTKKFDDNMICLDTNHALVLEFANRKAMHELKVQIEGTILSNMSVDHIVYRKLSSNYQIGYAVESKVKIACKTITEIDEQLGEKGNVAFVDDLAEKAEDISLSVFESYLPGYDLKTVTKTELQDIESTYLIGTTVAHSYYGAMDSYSIISRTDRFTVLVRNNTAEYQKCKELNKILSNNAEIDIRAFEADGGANIPFSLERGSYSYKARISVWDLEEKPENITGTFSIRNGETIFAKQQISCSDMDQETGEILISVPLYLKEKVDDIYCEVQWSNGMETSIQPVSITLTAEKYQFGQEEDEFGKLINSIKTIDCIDDFSEKIYLAVVETTKECEEKQIASTAIEEMLPNCEIETMDYSRARHLTEDALLLTYGFSKNQFRLLENYNIIGHAGQYTLWVRNDGMLLQNALNAGCVVYNSGKKLSVSSILAMSGESSIVNLPKAIYNITVEINVEEMEEYDTVEVFLVRDKTEKEIAEEMQELLDRDYTRDEAKQKIELQEICADEEYMGYSFHNRNTKIVNMKTKKADILNLNTVVYQWNGNYAEGKIEWIEME